MGDYAKRVERDGKHFVERGGYGFPIEIHDALTAEKVAQGFNRAFEHGKNEIRDNVKGWLDIKECSCA